MSELKAYNEVATADVNPEVVDSLGCTEWHEPTVDYLGIEP